MKYFLQIMKQCLCILPGRMEDRARKFMFVCISVFACCGCTCPFNCPYNSNRNGIYLSFHGGEDRVTVQNNPSLVVDDQLTIEAWIRYDGGGGVGPRIIEIIDTFSLHIYPPSTSRLGFGLFSSVFPSENGWTRIYSPEGLPQNTWVHVAGSWDGNTMRLFVDGVLNGPTAFTGPLYHEGPGDQSLKIGNGWTHIDGFNGGIFGVRFSSIARYTENFEPTMHPEHDASTIGLWRFDEGEGNIAHDVSTNFNHGEISGAIWASDGPI